MTEIPTRQRILDAAMPLFAERGFRGTTVGDIEAAAGLAPRRGGLYRHFASKEAVFRSAVIRYAEKFGPIEGVLDGLDFSNERAVLTIVGQITLETFRAEADLFRILQRDGRDFPELTEHVHAQLIQRGYDLTIELFRRLLGERGLPVDDARELAAIALGSLVHYREDEAIYGITPARAAEQPFLRVWVDTWCHVLQARLSPRGDHPPTEHQTHR